MNITEEELLLLLDEKPALGRAIVKKLREENAAREVPPYVKSLFGPQLAFFNDPAKKKAAVCSRRAGKTEAVAAWLLEGARDSPGGQSVYIALSRNNCRMILWKTLQAIDSRHNIGLKFRERDNQLVVITENGHEIWLAGCKDSAEIEKFRGLKLRRAAIDEGASYGPFLRQLVEDVLEPALLDLNGEICIIGTPGVSPTGYFFEITTGSGTMAGSAAKWATHSWTMMQNPHIQLVDVPPLARDREILAANYPDYLNARSVKYLENKLAENQWTADHPTYRREWLGEWVLDGSALVYPYNANINECLARDMPDSERWTFALGVDVGFNDPTAFVVGCYRKGHPEIYIVHAEKHEGMIPSRVAARIGALKNRWNISTVVMDTGGIGKGYAEECSQRYGIHIQPAEKSKKLAFIEIMRGELLSGNIKVDPHAAGELLLEWQNLVWHETKPEPDPRFENHLSDGALYLVRNLLPYYRPEVISEPLTEEQRVDKFAVDHRNKAKVEISSGKAKKRALRKLMAEIRAGKSMY